MADTITILLSFIGFGVTLVVFILGYIIKELRTIKRDEIRPMRQRVNTLWNSFFGVEAEGDKVVDGHLEEADDERESMRRMLEEAQEDHDRMFTRVRGIRNFLHDLSDKLNRELDGEVPHIVEDEYVDVEKEEQRWSSDDD